MKTKTLASFPTCGEVFELLINSLHLPEWSDIFSPTAPPDKARAGKVSDQLRDWACEPEGRVPSCEDFDKFIQHHTASLPHGDKLKRILTWSVNCALEEHTTMLRDITTHLDRDRTRSWYGRGKAPDAIYGLFILRKLLLRIPDVNGPILQQPLEKLLSTLWSADAPAHPLLKECFAFYRPTAQSVTEADVGEWAAGDTRSRFYSLASFFRGHERLNEIMLNFGLALLIEALGEAYGTCVSPEEKRHATDLLKRQSASLGRLEERLAADVPQSSRYSLDDYIRYLEDIVAGFRKFVVEIIDQGEATLVDLRWADLRCHRDYYDTYSRSVLPQGFKTLWEKIGALWNATMLNEPPDSVATAGDSLAALRRDYREWEEPLGGVFLAIEARLTLSREPKPTNQTLLNALEVYREAVSQCRYRVGFYTPHVIQEALGLAALIQRGKIAEGERLLDWIKNTLAWWDLAGFGKDFDHEQEAQRVEKAARKFIDELHSDLRRRLRNELSLQALDHAYYAGIFGFLEPEAMERLKEPVDKRQKRVLLSAATGRDQSPLMEVIDRRDIPRAFELVRSGADLNFINSTGDTCVTKAFARDAYDLVLEILRREENPIRRSALVRETDKNRHSPLERALIHGRVDVLRELTKWKRDRGGEIDLNQDRVKGGLTALYYSVMLLATHRMSPEALLKYTQTVKPTSQASYVANKLINSIPQAAEIFKELTKEIAENGYPEGSGMGYPDRAGEVISYLVSLVGDGVVDIDTTCTKGHTAFTLSVECHMHDIALQLLTAGANVNHRCDDGATALCFAIRDDDFEMAKLLHAHRADDRLFVPVLGRPIHAMEMSERIRQLYPRRV